MTEFEIVSVNDYDICLAEHRSSHSNYTTFEYHDRVVLMKSDDSINEFIVQFDKQQTFALLTFLAKTTERWQQQQQ